MSDITMCDGKKCHKRDQCYRFTAEVNPYRQAMFCKTPIQGKNCLFFWDNKHNDIDIAESRSFFGASHDRQ